MNPPIKLFLFASAFFVANAAFAAQVQLSFDASIPQLGFAADKVKAALTKKGHTLATGEAADTIRFKIQPSGKKPESFSIQRQGDHAIVITGEDAAGAMYGGLEVAELIAIGDLANVQAVEQSPYMAMRGAKLNIPLDARTPSYTDASEASQVNIPEIWSLDFWKSYIDSLAAHRYNFISLWTLHPFPSLVKVPDYPDIALADVHRSTTKWKEYYDLRARDIATPEIVRDFEVVKKITIEEKMDFWRQVMRYGKERNVDFYFIVWNIYPNGIDGKYGITDDAKNETTIDYYRKSVKQMFVTYPDLAGLGITAGENLNAKSVAKEAMADLKADWTFRSYGLGVLDAAKEFPQRKLTLIHRQHETGALEIAANFKTIMDQPNIDFLFSFKYCKAHAMSSTVQTLHPDYVKELKTQPGLETLWTLRNDSNYYFRWGAPDFVREFIQNIPREVTRGFYYGSDGYVWGRDFLSLHPETPRQLEIDRHWYHWMLWGRLGYDPKLSNARFNQILQARFPQVNAQQLFTAWESASMIFPLTTGFHWGDVDFKWYPEGCRSRPAQAGTKSGFHDVEKFISLPPHEGTDNISIPKYVKATLSNKPVKGTTPLQVSEKLHEQADRALRLLESLQAGDNQELKNTLADIRSMSYLGKYYAHKIRGSTEVALYRASKDAAYQQRAITELTAAADYWKRYTENAKAQYKNPLWTNRIGNVDWEKTQQDVQHDIAIARKVIP